MMDIIKKEWARFRRTSGKDIILNIDEIVRIEDNGSNRTVFLKCAIGITIVESLDEIGKMLCCQVWIDNKHANSTVST